MMHTTHAINTEPADVTGPASASLEHGLTACLGRMRLLAANAGSDDWYENWSREVLERRPLILVAVATTGRTDLWLMERGGSRDNAGDGVLYAAVSHLLRGDDQPAIDLGRAQRDTKEYVLSRIADHVDWLLREKTGEFLASD